MKLRDNSNRLILSNISPSSFVSRFYVLMNVLFSKIKVYY